VSVKTCKPECKQMARNSMRGAILSILQSLMAHGNSGNGKSRTPRKHDGWSKGCAARRERTGMAAAAPPACELLSLARACGGGRCLCAGAGSFSLRLARVATSVVASPRAKGQERVSRDCAERLRSKAHRATRAARGGHAAGRGGPSARSSPAARMHVIVIANASTDQMH
jgi:hypothetical protein